MIKEFVITFLVTNVTTGCCHIRKVVVYDNLETIARLRGIEFINDLYSRRSHVFEFKILVLRCNTLETRVI